MKNNAFAVVGDTVVFNDQGGYYSGGELIMGKPYTITDLSIPYRTEGTCKATLCSGARVCLSEVYSGRTQGGYTNYFEVSGESNYEIY